MPKTTTIKYKYELSDSMIIKSKDMICLIDSSVTNWDYMDDFLQALCNVDISYYMYSPAHTGNADRVREEVYTERIFAYEFYHQYRCIMSSDENKERYEGLFLNGEQTKTKEVVPDLEKCAPDLVMHRERGADVPNGQLWLCEIKMAKSHNPLSDITKIHDMVSLHFKENIFLFAGACKERLLLYIKNKVEIGEISLENDGNVICICSSCKCVTDKKYNYELYVDCHRLSELIKDQTDKDSLEKVLKKKKEDDYVLY